MKSFEGDYSNYYDLMYFDKDYRGEAEFVGSLVRQYIPSCKSILELGCGTGKHANLLAQMGYDVIATDFSNKMLECARRETILESGHLEFRWQDMRRLSVPEAPFDLVISLFDSIGYVVTNESLARVLIGVREHLRPGGFFIFEFWHSAAMLRGYDPVRVRRWPISDGELVRISETTLQPAQQTALVKYTIYYLRDDQTYSSFSETHQCRYFSIPEMDNWLKSSGFTPLKWFSGYCQDEAISHGTWHVLAVAERK